MEKRPQRSTTRDGPHNLKKLKRNVKRSRNEIEATKKSDFEPPDKKQTKTIKKKNNNNKKQKLKKMKENKKIRENERK